MPGVAGDLLRAIGTAAFHGRNSLGMRERPLQIGHPPASKQVSRRANSGARD
jgi:hypothetical protein